MSSLDQRLSKMSGGAHGEPATGTTSRHSKGISHESAAGFVVQPNSSFEFSAGASESSSDQNRTSAPSGDAASADGQLIEDIKKKITELGQSLSVPADVTQMLTNPTAALLMMEVMKTTALFNKAQQQQQLVPSRQQLSAHMQQQQQQQQQQKQTGESSHGSRHRRPKPDAKGKPPLDWSK